MKNRVCCKHFHSIQLTNYFHTDNFKIAICVQVVTLMSTDLLKHQQHWKEGLREIRELMALVETQVCFCKPYVLSA